MGTPFTFVFPGINRVLRFNYTLCHGVQPGIASLQIDPQDLGTIPSNVGTMQILFGNETQLIFPGCVIDKASIRRDPNSPMVACLAIKDRRWRWQYGKITGRYNLRLSDGTIDVATKKTTQELMRLLLAAMGEGAYDISNVPTQPYPEINWDYATPAHELEHLAEQVGCHVILRLDGSVLVDIVGNGAELPAHPSARTFTFGVDPPDKPDSVMVVGGPTRYQSVFKLRAVGQEKDTVFNPAYDNKNPRNLISGQVVAHGDILPINDLSYAPAGGWGSEWLSGRSFGNIRDLEQRKRAQETIYRWYAIAGTADRTDGLCTINGYRRGPVAPWQVCPLENGIVQSYVEAKPAIGNGFPPDQFFNVEQPFPPRLTGKWHSENPDFKVNDTFRQFPYGFQIDRERGIVMLPFPICKLIDDVDKPFAEPDLYLEIGHTVKDATTRQPERFTKELRFGDQVGTGPLVLRREDVVRRVINGWDLSNGNGVINPMGGSDTQDSAEQEANYYLEAYIRQFQSPETAQVEYNGILAISPDGAISQVEWAGSESGCTTKASRNTEFSLVVPSYQQRREITRVRRQLAQSAANAAFANRNPNAPARGPL